MTLLRRNRWRRSSDVDTRAQRRTCEDIGYTFKLLGCSRSCLVFGKLQNNRVQLNKIEKRLIIFLFLVLGAELRTAGLNSLETGSWMFCSQVINFFSWRTERAQKCPKRRRCKRRHLRPSFSKRNNDGKGAPLWDLCVPRYFVSSWLKMDFCTTACLRKERKVAAFLEWNWTE